MGEGRDAELRFFRDVEGREVDFVQLLDGKPIRFVETKLADTAISPALLHLRRKFPAVEAVQVVIRLVRVVCVPALPREARCPGKKWRAV